MNSAWSGRERKPLAQEAMKMQLSLFESKEPQQKNRSEPGEKQYTIPLPTDKPYHIVNIWHAPAYGGKPPITVFHYYKTIRELLWMIADQSGTEIVDGIMKEGEAKERGWKKAEFVMYNKGCNAGWVGKNQWGVKIHNASVIETADGKVWDLGCWQQLRSPTAVMDAIKSGLTIESAYI